MARALALVLVMMLILMLTLTYIGIDVAGDDGVNVGIDSGIYVSVMQIGQAGLHGRGHSAKTTTNGGSCCFRVIVLTEESDGHVL